MTAQQSADIALALWQANRDLPPELRLELLFFDFVPPPSVSSGEYEATLRRVDACMREAA